MMEEDRNGKVRARTGGSPPAAAEEIDRILALADMDAGVEDHVRALERLTDARQEGVALSPRTRFAIESRILACLERLGRAEEAQSAARVLLEAAPLEIPPVERARCLLVAGRSALMLGQLSTARSDAQAALATLGEAKPLEELGQARNLLGTVAFRSGEPGAARDHFEKALEIFRRIGNLQHLAGTYVNLGNLHKLRCDWESAAERYHVAYYLGTTLGESGLVAGAAQNLGIVLSKTGRYRDARSYFEKGLKIAQEMADPVRVLRARLALARIDRAERKTTSARTLLSACREACRQKLPHREHCLLLLEETRLELQDGALEEIAAPVADLRLRVEATAPRGDLMVEVLLLEADVAAARGDWGEVTRAADGARELARIDKDRAQEERALQRLAVAWAHSGRGGEAETAITGLLARHRRRSEWPSVAAVLEVRGRIEQEVQGDAKAAMADLGEAAEVYRRIGLPRAAALAEAERVRCLVLLGRQEEALARLEGLVRSEVSGEPFPALERVLARLSEEIQGSGAVDSVVTPDGLKVHARLEAILAAPGSVWERLREILSLLREALDVDELFLARAVEGDLEILASLGFEALQGKATVPLSLLGLRKNVYEEPSCQLDLDGVTARGVGSRLTIPISLRGRLHLLCLQRNGGKDRAPLSRVESNYAMVLAAEIARVLELGTPDQEVATIARGIALADVITQDARMLQILDLIGRVGDTDLTVLLQGETGTGKKLLAHAIHRASSRRDRSIVTVDCAALPETLLEAELFGYRKGSFTGANQDRSGLLAEAAGGTVFLDEIDKAGLTVQRRFLHLLDSGEIRPVGSTSYVRLDARIICATSSQDLRTEVAEGRFLKDLYYRLNDISIQIPPLRERRDDTLLLAGCFVETFANQVGRKVRGMSNGFRQALQMHDWPGNVRELEKAMRRAVTLADDNVLLTPELLPIEVLEVMDETAEESGTQLRSQVEAFERRAIQRALEACNGNKTRAAALLGLSRKGLKGKIARYRIGRGSGSGG